MQKATTPKVFISYSHDSAAHKDWVRRLAERLQINGVDIVLDQWDIQPGDDVTAFVEKGLRECDRVLIVCTSKYIHKANTLKGGVGYERMIITGEVAKDLNTKKFIPIVRGDSKQRVPEFLGTRIYVDFSGKRIPAIQYDLLLRAILGYPRHKRPILGAVPYVSNRHHIRSNGRSRKKSSNTLPKRWTCHWHAGVRRFCGHRLYIVLLRLAHQDTLFKESILDNIKEVDLKDYVIFRVFSNWDLLIRIWTNESSFQVLKKKLDANSDILAGHCQSFEIQELRHVPEVDKYATEDAVQDELKTQANLKQLGKIQRGLDHTGFKKLKHKGLILDPSVRYAPRRIQFFVAMYGQNPFTRSMLEQLEQMMRGTKQYLFNSTIYRTTDSTMRALLKGQVRNYYDVARILEKLTAILSPASYTTQTMLVASGVQHQGTQIDFEKAEDYVLDQRFNYEFASGTPNAGPLRRLLRNQYHDASDVFPEDPKNIMRRLIRAKMEGDGAEMSSIIGSVFAPLEGAMRKKLGPVLSRAYRSNANDIFAQIKIKEQLSPALNMNNTTIGDLCKLYKNIILEKGIVEIAPLSPLDFPIMMEKAPNIRNQYLHQSTCPDEREWSDLFSFFSKFIPIHHRLTNYFRNLD
jgi:hypothetical protein